MRKVGEFPFLPIRVCNKSSAVAEMGDRGHNIDMGLKEGGAVPLCGRWEPV